MLMLIKPPEPEGKLDFHSPAVRALPWEAITGSPLAAGVCGSLAAGVFCGGRVAAGRAEGAQ
jgi:hypothetical protein